MRMKFTQRGRSALFTYIGIQVFWGALLLLTPVLVAIYPSRLWAIPFGCVTMAGGVHLTYFRYEYDALVGRLTTGVPFLRYLAPSTCRPEYYLPIGIAYTMLGVVSVATIIYPLHFTFAPLLKHLL